MTSVRSQISNGLFSSNTIQAAVVLFVTTLAIYAWTMAPTVVFVDSGELIVAAKSLGVAHPPGFPLYVLLAHLATAFPLSSVAARVNFLSAACAALAVAFVFLLIIEMFKTPDRRPPQKRPHSKKKRMEEPSAISLWSRIEDLLPACSGALIFAFSRTLWSFATVAEVYTLNTLLLVAIFYLVFRWRTQILSPSSRVRTDTQLFVAAFLFGLALGVHHVTVAVTLPALVFLVYRTDGSRFFSSRKFLYTASLLVLGFVFAYSYLPLAASRSPLMNWGDPRTAERFWWHITGRQYQVFISFSAQQTANQASQFAHLLAHEFGPIWFPIGLALAVVGLVEMFRRHRITFWFVILVVICDLGYALNYEIAEDKGAYYLPAFIGVAVGASFGTRFLLRYLPSRLPRPEVRVPVAIALTLLVPLAGFAANFPYANRHNFFLAVDYINDIESTVAPGGMLLTSDWQVYSPVLYLREVEQVRRDVIAIDLSLLRRSWYFDYLKTVYPELIEDNRASVEAFLTDLRHWENDPDLFSRSNELTSRISNHFLEMLLGFVRTQMRRAPVYVTWEIGLGVMEDPEFSQVLSRDYQLVPQGLVFEISADKGFQMPADPEYELRGLNDGTFRFDPDDVVMLKVFPVYANMLVNRGRYLAAYGLFEDAARSYQRALGLSPDNKLARDGLNEVMGQMRK